MSPREEILQEALALICGARQREHGDPVETHQNIAAMFNAATGHNVDSYDVVIMHICTKLARIKTSPANRDSWVDIAGYAAIGFECAKES